MSESFERFHPALTPEQAETMLIVSDAFALWAGCKRPACRRSGACRGFTGRDAPYCVPRLIGYFRVVLDAIGALLPDRRPRVPTMQQEFDQQMLRMRKRMADVMERRLEELEQRAGARAAATD